MPDSVYVITPVHNRRAVTVKFAQTLARQTLSGITLVLVDDGSTDGTGDAVRVVLPTAVVLRGDGSLWWGGGLRRGFSWLRSQHLADETVVVTMNDDIAFDDDYFEKAVAELRTLGQRAFLVSPGVYQTSGRLSREAGVTDWSRFKVMHYGDSPERIDHATTRCLFMSWGAAKRIDGFHPTLVPHYTSDYVFTMTAARKGIRLVPARTVCARFSDETTGDHGLARFHGTARLKQLFSPRFSYNPLHQFFFVWYACPWVYKVPCWVRILIVTLKHLR